MFKIVLVGDGTLVNDNAKKGYTEADAAASVRERNDRAEALGVEARYEAVPL